MKNNKGITLIALIVTIIVLIILAGVAIAMLQGDNGILKSATTAKYDTVLGSVQENVGLAALSVRTKITENMVSVDNYLATNTTHFQKLVDQVTSDLSSSTKSGTANTEGYAVYNFLDAGTVEKDGTGYIVITYSDNALRSSLPSDETSGVQNSNGSTWRCNTTDYNVVSMTNNNYVNQAVVVYVITVGNYSCELSKPVLTTSTEVSSSIKTSVAAVKGSAIGQAMDLVQYTTPTTP